MAERVDKLIKVVYQKWKSGQLKPQKLHPDEEALACFLEGRLSDKENEQIKAHIISCDDCSRALAVQLRMGEIETKDVPEELLKSIKDLAAISIAIPILEIILRIKEKVMEILSTTGDVLVGQELVPAPVLRSRQIKDFKDEVTILKDFQDIRVEAKIENKQGKAFSLSITVKEKASQKMMKDLRVTLIKDDVELESYLTDSGKVTFEYVLLGKYTVEVANIENKIASILLDIKR
jgi:hypothetical protein